MSNEHELRTNEFEDRPELIKKRARSILATRTLISLSIFVLICILTLLATNAILSMMTRQQIVGCSVPGYQCYETSQKRTEDAIKVLIENDQKLENETRKTVILALLCNKKSGIDTVDEIANCVRKERLKEGK